MMIQNLSSKLSKQYILLALFAIVLIIIIIAVITGDDRKDAIADWAGNVKMKDGGTLKKEWFDLEVSNISKNVAKKYNISPLTRGVVVSEIEGSRDVIMKLQKGDVISEINGKRVNNVKDFRKLRKNINPAEGLLLDIKRDGYPMYISILGTNNANKDLIVPSQSQHLYSNTEVVPFFDKSLNPGGINMKTGSFGKDMVKWLDKNYGSGYYACPSCGTLVPARTNMKNKVVLCPNCKSRMVLK